MRIKNQISTESLQGILCLFLMFLAFFVIDLFIIGIGFSSGMTLSGFWSWIYSGFMEADFEMKLVFIALIVLPIFMLVALVVALKKRSEDAEYASINEHFIRQVEFLNEGIKLTRNNPNFNDAFMYNHVSMELVIKTGMATNKYGRYSVIYGVDIILIDENGKQHKIDYSPINLNNLYKLVYYSQFMKGFSYRFTGTGEQTKTTLANYIQDYIKNGYKKTWKIFISCPLNPWIVLLIVLLSIGAGVLMILSLFR